MRQQCCDIWSFFNVDTFCVRVYVSVSDTLQLPFLGDRRGHRGEGRASAFLRCFVFQWSYLLLVCTRDVQCYHETRDVILYRFLISFHCVLFMFSFMTSQRIECVTRFPVTHSATVFLRCSSYIVVTLRVFKCYWHIKILIYIYIIHFRSM